MIAIDGTAPLPPSPLRIAGTRATTRSVAIPAYDGVGELGDDVLAVRARDGDTRSFEVLLRRYHRQMFALAARITGSAADADDVVQVAFLTAWRKLPAFRADARFATWLYRIVTNQSLSLLRRRREHDPISERDDRAPATRPTDGPEACAERVALADDLAVAVARLSPDLRAAWLLCDVERCSYEEVASILSVTTSTARGRIARARGKLAEALAAWR